MSSDGARAAPAGAEVARARDAELWRAYRRHPTAAARDHLFAHYATFARGLARRQFLDRRSGDIELPDLHQLAYAGLLEAIDGFDPTVGAPFKSYARRRITGSILDGVSKMSEQRGQASFRRRVREERLRSLSDAGARAAPADALDRLSELAIGLALGFMLEDAGLYTPEGAAERGPDAYESLAWRENQQRLLEALSSLPDREQTIVRSHYFDDLDFERIGAILGVGKARVSQLHRAAIELLRKRIRPAAAFGIDAEDHPMDRRQTTSECPAAPLSAAIDAVKTDPAVGLGELERLLDDYPRDPRLHFLKGSVLAGMTRYEEARGCMETATRIAPDYAIARFQLGFLELTSGEADRALATWGPLHRLAEDNALRLFATGLDHLIHDRFEAAKSALQAGIAHNTEVPPLNADMGLIIAKMQALAAAPAPQAEQPLSAAHLLLQQYKTNSKAH